MHTSLDANHGAVAAQRNRFGRQRCDDCLPGGRRPTAEHHMDLWQRYADDVNKSQNFIQFAIMIAPLNMFPFRSCLD